VTVVLDCSLALAWALPDETSKKADQFLDKVSKDTTFWVPALWWYELANGLTMAQRRGRLTESDGLRLVELYRQLSIQTDLDLHADTAWRFQTLAKEHHLSAYDAAYLELAQRKSIGLATLDRQLLRAARDAGVKVLPRP
jgi:predicted nucleic acid-binding protein